MTEATAEIPLIATAWFFVLLAMDSGVRGTREGISHKSKLRASVAGSRNLGYTDIPNEAAFQSFLKMIYRREIEKPSMHKVPWMLSSSGPRNAAQKKDVCRGKGRDPNEGDGAGGLHDNVVGKTDTVNVESEATNPSSQPVMITPEKLIETMHGLYGSDMLDGNVVESRLRLIQHHTQRKPMRKMSDLGGIPRDVTYHQNMTLSELFDHLLAGGHEHVDIKRCDQKKVGHSDGHVSMDPGAEAAADLDMATSGDQDAKTEAACLASPFYYYSASNSSRVMQTLGHLVNTPLLVPSLDLLGTLDSYGDDGNGERPFPSDKTGAAEKKERQSESSPSSAATSEHLSQNVWIGGGGVTAWCHYDASHNLFLQSYGRKRFLLMPPSAAMDLELHSFLSPLFRRSQTDVEERADIRFNDRNSSSPGLSEAKVGEATITGVLSVELGAGDLLYIPPFWFHQVSAVSPISISTNSWIGTREVAAAQKVIRQDVFTALQLDTVSLGLDLDKDASAANYLRQAYASVLEVAITKVVESALSFPLVAARAPEAKTSAARKWISRLSRSRWGRLVARHPKIMHRLRIFCAPEKKEDRWRLGIQHWTQRAESWTRHVADVYRSVGFVSGAGMEVELGNWIESVVYEVLGRSKVGNSVTYLSASKSVKIVPSFLLQCFE